MAKLYSFPGMETKEEEVRKEGAVSIDELLNDVASDKENIETLICVAIRNDGRVSWGSSSTDMCQVLWMVRAMDHIVMEQSLLGPDD